MSSTRIASNSLKEKLYANLEEKMSEAEPAWDSLTYQPGVDVWRVHDMKLESVSKEHHGTFYSGDSYLVLNTFKRGERMAYDVFIWIGELSTNDEYGTAAYKMAELDNIMLGGVAVQHREVQSHESDKFTALFPILNILSGGYQSGFNIVTPMNASRLFHVSGGAKRTTVTQVDFIKENITSDDVFIIDMGKTLYQVNGANANKDERFKGMQVANHIKSERGNCSLEIIDEYEVDSPNDVIDGLPSGERKKLAVRKEERRKEYAFWRISDATGNFEITKVKEGKISKSDLDSKDAFIYDTNVLLFVWIGSKTSNNERGLAMFYAEKFAEDCDKTRVPQVKVNEGCESEDFLAELE